jgi:DNA-binding PadR family transcriptional regulator
MTKAERKRVLLEFMAQHKLALPPAAIHRNLKLHEELHISPSTVENYLEELLEEGYVTRVDPEPLQQGEISSLSADEAGRAYYLITEDGVEEAASGKTNSSFFG